MSALLTITCGNRACTDGRKPDGKMKDLISKESVLNILDEMAEVSKRNWAGDEVLLDMIATIRNRVDQLEQ